MDFIVGILLIIIIILILFNFTSISMSDTKANGSCSRNNNSSSTNINKYLQNTNIPSPMLSNPPSALNNKINLNNQTYDYSKYFFM